VADAEGRVHSRIGELLVNAGRLSARDLERALAAQQEMGGLLGRVLVRLGLVSEADVALSLSTQLGIPLVVADEFPDFMPDVRGLLPDFLQANSVFPLRLDENELLVAMAVPQDAFLIKALRLATGCAVRPLLALESDIEKALMQPVEADSSGIDDGFGDGADSGDFVEHLKDLASEAPVIHLVNAIIGRVTDLRASDIHLEPFDDGLHVRYRIDGVILAGEVVPPRLSAAVNSRVKLLAHLDIAERRLPQDGRIKTRVKGRELDQRV
jgi:general secretion pathway protein E